MPAQATMLSPQQLIEAAKAPILAYNEKNWDKVRATLAPGFVYDEVGTHRVAEGIDQVIAMWQGWAAAMPDSKATFRDAVAGGSLAVVEVTWTGTHKGPLQLAAGTVPATGRRMEIRACMVTEMAGDKPKQSRHYFDIATLLQQLGISA
ncbi:MAG TPA: ester cyclase [Gemmatimonadales bacterium]|jgi:steroid delta-isomerase-like uncharacterized protein|nr:ester cyclase [Gemmatimonadales bacterium]